MIVAIAIVLAAACAIAAERLRAQRDRARTEATRLESLLVDAKNTERECAERGVKIAELTAERDTALVERNTAIDGVRWIALGSTELIAMSKTGCAHCRGAGLTETARTKAVCECVQKKMNADRKYGFTATGVPLRMATRAEIAAMDRPRRHLEVV